MFVSGSSRRESVFLPFPASRGCPYSLAHVPIHLQSQQWLVQSVSYHITVTLESASFFPYEDPCDDIGSIQDNLSRSANRQPFNPTCNLNSPLLHQVACSKLWGLGREHLGGVAVTLPSTEAGSSFWCEVSGPAPCLTHPESSVPGLHQVFITYLLKRFTESSCIITVFIPILQMKEMSLREVRSHPR